MKDTTRDNLLIYMSLAIIKLQERFLLNEGLMSEDDMLSFSAFMEATRLATNEQTILINDINNGLNN